MNDDLIDTSQIDVTGLPMKEFRPARKFRILMTRTAHEAVWHHARRSLSESREDNSDIVEVGGILIGDIYKDDQGPFLEVTAAIVGKHTKNEGTQMTFTPETWAHVNQVKSRKYPDARIVGWYHTHPRFGIFLSDMDKFIHKHNFSQPWTTALVVDPVQETEGFFVWTEGEPCLAEEYWVGGERRETARVAPARAVEEPRPAAAPHQPAESTVAQTVSAAAIGLCFVALLFLFWVTFSREATHSDTEKIVLQALNDQSIELQNSHDALMTVARQLAAAHKEGESDEQIQRILQADARLQRAGVMAELAEAKLTNRQDILDRLQQELSPPKPDDDKKNQQKPDASPANTDKQAPDKTGTDKPASNQQSGEKPATSQPAPAPPIDNKPDTAKPNTNKDGAGQGVKKQ